MADRMTPIPQQRPPAQTQAAVPGVSQGPTGPEEELPLAARLAGFSVERRSFLKYCAGLTAVLALPTALTRRVAATLDAQTKPSLGWFEFQDCAGDTESLLRARNPALASLILDLVSVDYQETIMSGAGHQAEDALAAALRADGYLLVVEGSVPRGARGAYCCVGGRSAIDHLQKAASGAAAIINVGTCSAFGGLPAAKPNPTDAVAVSDVVSGVPIVNLPGCPVNVDNLTATLVHFLTFGALPARDELGRPLFAYGDRIHDNCPRRGHFDAGQFAVEWGDEGHREGWCLYRLGCKGPSSYHNCPSIQWNGSTNWPIGAGHGCVGCAEPAFWDTMTPFYDRLPHVAGFGVNATAEKIGLTVVAVTAAGFALHGVGKAIQRRVGQRGDGSGPGDGTGPPGVITLPDQATPSSPSLPGRGRT